MEGHGESWAGEPNVMCPLELPDRGRTDRNVEKWLPDADERIGLDATLEPLNALPKQPRNDACGQVLRDSRMEGVFLLQSHRSIWYIWESKGNGMGDKNEVWLGTLSLMVLRTLATMGPQHGYGLAKRIEQISGDRLSVNYGTLYPALLKLEQDGAIRSEWGISDTKRKAKFYKLTVAGRKQLERETRDWYETTAILARFLSPAEEG